MGPLDGTLEHLHLPRLHGSFEKLVDLLLPLDLLEDPRCQLQLLLLHARGPRQGNGLHQEVLVPVLHGELQVVGGPRETGALPLREGRAGLIEVLGVDTLLRNLRNGAPQQVTRKGLCRLEALLCARHGVEEAGLCSKSDVVRLPSLQKLHGLHRLGAVRRKCGFDKGHTHALLLLGTGAGFRPVIDVVPQLPHSSVELVMYVVPLVNLVPLLHYAAPHLDDGVLHPDSLGSVKGGRELVLIFLGVQLGLVDLLLHLPAHIGSREPMEDRFGFKHCELHLGAVLLSLLQHLREKLQIVKRLLNVNRAGCLGSGHGRPRVLRLALQRDREGRHQLVARARRTPAPLPERQQPLGALHQVDPHPGQSDSLRGKVKVLDRTLQLVLVIGDVGRRSLDPHQDCLVVFSFAGFAALRLGSLRPRLNRQRDPPRRDEALLRFVEDVTVHESAILRVHGVPGRLHGILEFVLVRLDDVAGKSALGGGEQHMPSQVLDHLGGIPVNAALDLEFSLRRGMAVVIEAAPGVALDSYREHTWGPLDLLHHRVSARNTIHAHQGIARAQAVGYELAMDHEGFSLGV
mmetsp:Transcript_1339/g.2921  ORF Transcript_1339/g.2921 Transcript_1339/m.2921 type:complete len:574 (-) Transcript_1339:682-2403(-)